MQTAAGDIERLPEELLAAVVTLTSPPDACRAAAVSQTFRAVADSDAVWSHFLPHDLPDFAESESACMAASKKALFQCLCKKPVLLSCRGLCMKLDKATGDVYYHHRSKLVAEEEADMLCDEDEAPEPCEWISLGCGDTQRNKRFQSFQSAFWTS